MKYKMGFDQFSKSLWNEHGSTSIQVSNMAAPDVRDDNSPAAGPGRMSPNVDMAAADLSLSLPTCASDSMEPHLDVLSPNLLPTYLFWTIKLKPNPVLGFQVAGTQQNVIIKKN